MILKIYSLKPLNNIYSEKDDKAILIGCFNSDSFSSIAGYYHLLDRIWPKPYVEDKITASFSGILKLIKEQEDALINRKYLDTLIDSLPDLIWFKDAKGAHLKVNNSFCNVVKKTKEQIEGRGHYYIWGLEPDEYSMGEYICLESEEVVLNKKQTCIFDETVKCGKNSVNLKPISHPFLILTIKL